MLELNSSPGPRGVGGSTATRQMAPKEGQEKYADIIVHFPHNVH